MSSNLRLQQSQAQMEEVVSIMSVNVEKVLDRDIRLTEMDGKAEALEAGASVFKTSAGKLKRKYWWKNCKMMIMLGVICAIVMVAIVQNCADNLYCNFNYTVLQRGTFPKPSTYTKLAPVNYPLCSPGKDNDGPVELIGKH
ncbi:vesicle-associated membrane protein 1 isoform X8 [Lepidochelys kempii]